MENSTWGMLIQRDCVISINLSFNSDYEPTPWTAEISMINSYVMRGFTERTEAKLFVVVRAYIDKFEEPKNG